MDFLFVADGGEAGGKFGEGNLQGRIGDFGRGFVDGFDEIVGVAGGGNETFGNGADVLAHGLGGAAAVDVGGVDEGAGFEIFDAFNIHIV